MRHNLTLTIMSLLQILLMTFHFTDDTLRSRAGTPEAMGSTFIAIPILVLWLYATLKFAERRSGLVIILVGSLLSVGMPVIHMMGPSGVAGRKPESAYFFVWTMFALGVTGMFSLLLAVDGLRSRQGASRSSPSQQELT
ncbi:MAG TPA: hypothetical protein VE825_15240 [Terriglobales bacterium]|jgi:hypothetical protein|nr:hypothetical protein [Terriglobales bacterium]